MAFAGLVSLCFGSSAAGDPVARTVVSSVSSLGVVGNQFSREASISGDGRFIAFSSAGTNLVEGDTNGGTTPPPPGFCLGPQELCRALWPSTMLGTDVFVHDRDANQTGVFDQPGGIRTVRVSVTSDGREVRGDPADGRGSSWPAISADGSAVAFVSSSPELVPGDTNGFRDVFVHDMRTRVTERVSRTPDGGEFGSWCEAPSISSDARYVAFECSQIYVFDRLTGVSKLVAVSSDGDPANDVSYDPAISGDGRYVAFFSFADNLVAHDTNEESDVFVHDRNTGTTERISVSSKGTQSAGASQRPSISFDGRFVAFTNWGGDWSGDFEAAVAHVYVRDRWLGTTILASRSSSGQPGNHDSWTPWATSARALSADGRFLIFDSSATNFAPDSVGWPLAQGYVRDLVAGKTWRVSSGPTGTSVPSYYMHAQSISADGRHVAFWSDSSALAAGDYNLTTDIFVRSRGNGVCVGTEHCLFEW